VFFMPTALLLLASIHLGDGSAPVSAEIHEATLAELVRGSLFGNWSREGQRDGGAFLNKGILTLPMTPPAKMRLMFDAEGPGWFRGWIGQQPSVGIRRYQRGMLVICSNGADKGFPKCFEDGEQRDVVTLWPN
jgi:hypothetical protein